MRGMRVRVGIPGSRARRSLPSPKHALMNLVRGVRGSATAEGSMPPASTWT